MTGQVGAEASAPYGAKIPLTSHEAEQTETTGQVVAIMRVVLCYTKIDTFMTIGGIGYLTAVKLKKPLRHKPKLSVRLD